MYTGRTYDNVAVARPVKSHRVLQAYVNALFDLFATGLHNIGKQSDNFPSDHLSPVGIILDEGLVQPGEPEDDIAEEDVAEATFLAEHWHPQKGSLVPLHVAVRLPALNRIAVASERHLRRL